MLKARVLIDDVLVLNEGRYIVHIKVLDVPRSKRFQDGIKVRCVLVDSEKECPLLLLDNHAPFGFHLHTRLPEDNGFRVALNIKTYPEAIELFMREVKKVVSHG